MVEVVARRAVQRDRAAEVSANLTEQLLASPPGRPHRTGRFVWTSPSWRGVRTVRGVGYRADRSEDARIEYGERADGVPLG